MAGAAAALIISQIGNPSTFSVVLASFFCKSSKASRFDYSTRQARKSCIEASPTIPALQPTIGQNVERSLFLTRIFIHFPKN